jgi:putative membrane protein
VFERKGSFKAALDNYLYRSTIYNVTQETLRDPYRAQAATEAISCAGGTMTKNERVVCGVAALSVLLGASATLAPTGTNAISGRNPPKNGGTTQIMSDAEFAEIAAEGGLAEVKMGELAEEKSTVQVVKDFGKRMITDHGKAYNELKAAAAEEKITLPSGMSTKDQEEYSQLAKLEGEAFDRTYARDMVSDHTANMAVFNYEARVGKEGPIQSFASQTIRTLEEHLNQAREMERSISNEPKKSEPGER